MFDGDGKTISALYLRKYGGTRSVDIGTGGPL